MNGKFLFIEKKKAIILSILAFIIVTSTVLLATQILNNTERNRKNIKRRKN